MLIDRVLHFENHYLLDIQVFLRIQQTIMGNLSSYKQSLFLENPGSRNLPGMSLHLNLILFCFRGSLNLVSFLNCFF